MYTKRVAVGIGGNSARKYSSFFYVSITSSEITHKRNRYTPGEPKVLGTFQPTENWEDTFAQRRIDVGKFYASKDNDYPTTTQGETRRINWGWAQTPPQSTQTLPREITFNAAARVLQQAPIEELKQLRQGVAYQAKDLSLKSGSSVQMNLKENVAKQSEVIVNFELPKSESTFGISIGKPGSENPGTKVTTYVVFERGLREFVFLLCHSNHQNITHTKSSAQMWTRL